MKHLETFVRCSPAKSAKMYVLHLLDDNGHEYNLIFTDQDRAYKRMKSYETELDIKRMTLTEVEVAL